MKPTAIPRHLDSPHPTLRGLECAGFNDFRHNDPVLLTDQEDPLLDGVWLTRKGPWVRAKTRSKKIEKPLKRGDKVRMSHAYKSAMNSQVIPGVRKNPKHPHPLIKELGRCIGTVLGPMDYGKDEDGEPILGPEIDVRWRPPGSRYGLRYGYLPEDLVIVKRS